VSGGDSDEDFRDFVLGSGRALHRTAYLLTGDWALAEDMVQNALARAYLSWDRVRVLEQPEAYVRRLMINQRISWWRRHRVAEVPLQEQSETASDAALVPAERDELRAALLQLGVRQRQAVVLRYYCDLSERDVADALGCSVGNVKSLTSRGVARLRVLLAQDDRSEEPHA
jgi:RNA polymerase sigma-70 factor (sigma-E family)